MSGGVVVAAVQAAAEAGAGALRAGGTAVDAAVATAFALCVVDPASCGLGGYGGFMSYARPGGEAVVVDFNTWVPERVDASALRTPGDDSQKLDGGASIAPPEVVPGLVAAHSRFGRLPLAEVVAPAIRLAADGFVVGQRVAGALAGHHARTAGGTRELAEIFFPAGDPPAAGTTLVQSELAGTLERVAAEGDAPFRRGRIAEAICEAARSDGGFLEPADLLRDTVSVGPAYSVAFEAATVSGPSPETSGAGVVYDALRELDPSRLEANRGRGYLEEVTRALRAAWQARSEAARAAAMLRHTTTLAAADAEGGVVALTFTHGSLWFGSGLVAPGTGVVLNAGANLFVAGPQGPVAMTNMSPVAIEEPQGGRHAFGAVGGPRIPGIVLTAVVDAVHYGMPLSAALAAPHLSVRATDGAVEAEAELAAAAGVTSTLAPGDSGFGCAAGVSWSDGCAVPAADPRFDAGVAAG